MRIAIGCDHVGYALKSALIEALERDEHAVLDLGTHGPDPTDYPPVARAVATAIAKNFVDLGVVACASGAGASIAANRFTGIRAAVCADPDGARQSRERLDVNVVCVEATLDPPRLVAIVREWLGASFGGADPDVRALAKLAELEGALRPAGARAAQDAPARDAAPAVTASPAAPTPVTASPAEPPPGAPAAVAGATRASDITAVMKVVAAIKDGDTKLIATRVLQFLRNRFPQATGAPRDDGFTFTLDGQHVATVAIGRNFVELEAGPERITTSKIRDTDGLDVMLALPSVAKAFDAVKTEA